MIRSRRDADTTDDAHFVRRHCEPARLAFRASRLAPRISRLASRASHLASRVSHLASRASRLAPRVTHLASRISRLAFRVSRLAFRVRRSESSASTSAIRRNALCRHSCRVNQPQASVTKRAATPTRKAPKQPLHTPRTLRQKITLPGQDDSQSARGASPETASHPIPACDRKRRTFSLGPHSFDAS